MTVVFHVDDLQVSHKSNKAIKKVIEYIDVIYPGPKAVLGDVNEYLVMRCDYSTKGNAELSMTPYMNKVLDQLPKEITTDASMPATYNPFKV